MKNHKTKLLTKKRWLQGFILGCLSTMFSAIPASGAERISLSSPLGEFTVSVSSLEEYAKTGKIDEELGFYAQFVKPEEMTKLREALQLRVDLSPVMISQFLYSSIGATSLKFFGGLIQTESHLNGFYALRSALVLAAADKDGLNLINVLKKFPSSTIRVSSTQAFTLFGVFTQFLDKTDKVSKLIEEESETEGNAQPFVNKNPEIDLQKKGNFTWQKETLSFNDNRRNRSFIGDLYLPQSPSPVPVLIISHGVADNRKTFAYLGEYLASYGFAVVAIEHPGSNTEQLQNLFLGAAREPVETNEFVDRPQDVSFVIDGLTNLNQNNPQIKDKLNLQEIGIIGHSFGGYTALALAGAKFNFGKLKQECRTDNYNLNAANASLFLQCLALNLPVNVEYKIEDKRIKAVFAMNPAIGSIFGEKGLSNIKLPIMLLGGSDDAVTPHLLEQVCPFTWLKTPDKYLVKIQGGTHVYDNQGIGGGAVPVPSPIANPDPLLSQKYVQITSLAFAKTYVANDPQYRQFLTPSYIQTISKPPLPIHLLRSLTAKQLSEKIKYSCPSGE